MSDGDITYLTTKFLNVTFIYTILKSVLIIFVLFRITSFIICIFFVIQDNLFVKNLSFVIFLSHFNYKKMDKYNIIHFYLTLFILILFIFYALIFLINSYVVINKWMFLMEDGFVYMNGRGRGELPNNSNFNEGGPSNPNKRPNTDMDSAALGDDSRKKKREVIPETRPRESSVPARSSNAQYDLRPPVTGNNYVSKYDIRPPVTVASSNIIPNSPLSNTIPNLHISNPIFNTPLSNTISNLPLSSPISSTPLSGIIHHAPVSNTISSTPLPGIISYPPVSNTIPNTPIYNPVFNTPIYNPVFSTPVSNTIPNYPLPSTINNFPIYSTIPNQASSNTVPNFSLSTSNITSQVPPHVVAYNSPSSYSAYGLNTYLNQNNSTFNPMNPEPRNNLTPRLAYAEGITNPESCHLFLKDDNSIDSLERLKKGPLSNCAVEKLSIYKHGLNLSNVEITKHRKGICVPEFRDSGDVYVDANMKYLEKVGNDVLIKRSKITMKKQY